MSHAVRWAQRFVIRTMEDQCSKWHWTIDSQRTICGCRIPVGNYGFLPEMDDDVVKINCKICFSKMKTQARFHDGTDFPK